jgi:hypothetical protein
VDTLLREGGLEDGGMRVEGPDCEIQGIEGVERVSKSDDEAWDTDMLISKVMILIQSWIL